MTHIRSQDTKPEVRLRKALWKRGIRYRKNYKLLPGKPDIAITRFRIAVFVDGDFFHGKNLEKIKTQVKSNREYWIPKIERNMERDKQVNDELLEMGWLVLRLWESDIKKDLDNCVSNIIDYCKK